MDSIDIKDADKITMTHTGLIQGNNGKVIHISFERATQENRDYAEIILPGTKVIKNKGFDEGEIAQLRIYLKKCEKQIVATAKQINHDLIFKL